MVLCFIPILDSWSDSNRPHLHSQCRELGAATAAAKQKELELGRFVRIHHWGDSDSIYDGDYTVRYLVHTTIKPGWFQEEKSCFMVAGAAPTLHVSNGGTAFEWSVRSEK